MIRRHEKSPARTIPGTDVAAVFRRILVPHDFSAHADHALREAARLLPPGGELILLHAIVPIVPVDELPVDGLGRYISAKEFRHGALRRLEHLVKRIFGRKPPRLTMRVALGDPYQCILRESRRADLIVMATVGRTGLAHMVIGSVAEKVVRHSAIPVLTLRPTVARRGRPRRPPRRGRR